MSSRRHLLAVATGSALLGIVPSAHAFCVATTCDPSRVGGCATDDAGCLTEGYPLSWASSCVTVSVQADAAPRQHIDYVHAAASATRAFAAWTAARCAGGAPSLTVEVKGPISCNVAEYNSDRGNANIVSFREDSWPYAGGQDALGITILDFDPKTGEIWDADIEINAVDATLSVGDPTPREVDLDSLLTHEAGHLLGLAHTAVKSATMFPGYTSGSISLRTLSADDVNGLCSIYSPDRRASSASCEPRHGYSDLCGADQTDPALSSDPQAGKGCSFVAAPWSAARSWEVGFGLVLTLLLARRAAPATMRP